MKDMLKALLIAVIAAGSLILGGVVFLLLSFAVLFYLGVLWLTGRGVVKPARQWGYREDRFSAAEAQAAEQRVIIDAQYEEIKAQTREF